MQLYPRAEVCEWLATNYDCFGKKVFQLASYLCRENVPKPAELLEISRVCELPEDLADFVIVCNMLLESN